MTFSDDDAVALSFLVFGLVCLTSVVSVIFGAALVLKSFF